MRIKILEKLDFTQKIIYFSLAVVVVIGFSVFFVVKPSADHIKDIKKDIKEQRAKLEKKYLMGWNAKILSKNAQEIKDNLKIFNKLFIPKDGHLDLVTSLERMAQRNNLEQEINILTNNANNKGSYKIVPVHIEVKGRFRNQLALVSDLKNETDYQFNINSLKFRSEDPSALSALKKRPPQETQEKITTTTEIKIEDGQTTTTKEVVLEGGSDINPQKDISLMILGEVYWEK